LWYNKLVIIVFTKGMEQQTGNPRILKITWAGYFGAILVYIFIAYQISLTNNIPFNFNVGELSDVLFLALFMFGLLLSLGSHLFLPKVLKDKEYNQRLNLQFAFSEVAGIFGIMLFSLNDSFSQLVTLCLVSLISLLKLFPQE